MSPRGTPAEKLERLQVALADRYTIEATLGTGGMATVYRARDLKHQRTVAIKVLHPELAAGVGHERFLREIQIAANLAHPHIVTLLESGEVGGFLYYVMPLIEGESLRERLHRDGRLPTGDCVRILRDIADALAYAHQHGVVHRDIKPGNILLAGQHALVADFGVAKAIHDAAKSETITTGGLSIGTPAYCSPEQAVADPGVDHRADIYSFGIVAYEMLTGRPPFVDLSPQSILSAQVTKTPVPITDQRSALPPGLARIVMRCLEKDPADRYQDARELAAQLDALDTPPDAVGLAASAAAASTRDRRWRRLIGSAIVLAAAGATAVMLTSRSRPELDPNVIAVAPFDVLGGDLETWREGLVDLLSASLDGAGPLKSVSPSTAIKEWRGRPEPQSALDMAERVRAGLVVFGRLVAAGPDSARVTAMLYDATLRRAIAEFGFRDAADRIDRLADSLALGIMSELSRRRALGAWRLASLGASSPAALKEFLRGEQHYRRFELDSAKYYYERAIGFDSTFALAHNRLAYALGWSLRSDPAVTASFLRAGELNRGLARRESLLIAADSLSGALRRFSGDSASWWMWRRELRTLEMAAREYPLDPQVWYQLGETRYHRGPEVGVTIEETRDAFARAVVLDSAFVPAYRHLVELTLRLDGPEAARPVLQAYLARAGPGLITSAEQVTNALLGPRSASDAEVELLLRELSTEEFYQVWYDLKWWPDTAESAIRVARAWAGTDDGLAPTFTLGQSLAFRGHLGEALKVAGDSIPGLFAELARLGAVPPDTARAVFGRWLAERRWAGMYSALPSWAQTHDTTSLRIAAGWWDSLRTNGPPELEWAASHFARVANAWLALARGDSADALARLAAVPNWPCYTCYHEQLARARILIVFGRDQEAAELLDHMPFLNDQVPPAEAVIAALERGRVHERLGNRAEALEAFSFVVNAWRKPDRELEGYVEEAKVMIGELTGEPER